MSHRAAAWSLWGLARGFAAAGLVFGVLSFSAALPEGREPFLASIVVLDALLVLYGALGALIASRRGRNVIGWIFCFVALSLGVISFASAYADYALTDWRPASDAFFVLGVAGFASIPVSSALATSSSRWRGRRCSRSTPRCGCEIRRR
jgi:hypothetical protein